MGAPGFNRICQVKRVGVCGRGLACDSINLGVTETPRRLHRRQARLPQGGRCHAAQVSALPHLRVHQILRTPPQQGAAQVIQGAVGHRLTGFMGGRADVRQGDRIAQLEQR